MADEDGQLNEEELAYWLAFDQVKGCGIGTAKIRYLYERLESLKTAWNASKEVLMRMAGFNEHLLEKFMAKRNEIEPQALLEELRKSGISAVPFIDERYPFRLRQIHDPPAVLYINGAFSEADFNWVIGIVGTRNPTNYGQRIAKEFSRYLSEQGVHIASGMALGIDSLSHWGAIEGGSKTIAVLPCGADNCYPSTNKRLFKTMIEEGKGIVVSEYFPGTKPDKFRFPERNRIVSGLSRAVLVIEGNLNSGSLITARLAFEQNREVFAVPGRIDSVMSEGPNDLIARNMAHILRKPQQVMDELEWVQVDDGRNVTTMVELYGREKEVYELLSAEPIHFDVLCQKTGMAAGEMSATLTMLELAGVVNRLPGDWYVLYRSSLLSNAEPILPE
ncbi:MAG: DNA-processing protein DprA [Candidatus Obscuribacterales bacterium]|nr:DNA-processing protein DprA [Candidatus Obscuribacterales bacterium]